MKNLINRIMILIILLTVSSNLIAQNYDNLNADDQIKNTSIDQFIGKWKYSGNDFELILNLSKENIPIGSVKTDGIIGFHELKKKNQIISKSERPIEQNELLQNATFFTRGHTSETNKIEGYFILDKNSTKYRVQAIISNSKDELLLSLSPAKQEGIIVNKKETKNTFNLPKELKFKKVTQ
ncbi:DUF6705 family protein [Sphingobacterium sp. Mn56C]|uniref:DUF6705 family protein n=1 Tax=Sphingobacterium sp. Mn56C TaxID=3395261 RepID=UPI003BE6DC3C